jgi:hypothetical protein
MSVKAGEPQSARTSVRTRHRQLLRQRWRFFVLFGVAMLTAILVASVFATGPLQRGFILGSGITIVAAMITAFVVLLSGTAPLMMGELAEQWTAQELRPLSNHGWRLVNHFVLSHGDQDHVLVGPGGVVLVETKWSSTPWALDERDYFFRRALQQTADNAAQLQRWAGVQRHGAPLVEPVLVLWGAASDKIDGSPVRRHESGVLVVSGKQVQDWALRRGRDQLDEQQVQSIWSEITQQVRKRDVVDRDKRPMPRSVQELVLSALGCFVAALVGFVVAAQLLELTGSVLAWAARGLVLLAAAELVRRRADRWRWPARSFQLGTVALYAVGAVLLIRAYLLT